MVGTQTDKKEGGMKTETILLLAAVGIGYWLYVRRKKGFDPTVMTPVERTEWQKELEASRAQYRKEWAAEEGKPEVDHAAHGHAAHGW